MRIGVIADTHLPGHRAYLPKALRDGLAGVDLILHMGDWVSLEVVPLLEAIAPVDGIAGNNDGSEIIERFGFQKLLRLEHCLVGLVHGDGLRKTTEQRAYEAFAGEPVDLILFGHSHIPYKEQREGTLLFNPGSPTDKRRQPLYSYGIIELEGGQVRSANHYYYENKEG